jgi:uncharacterized membrane protein YphA (DoxX/SURF4 family)
MSLKKWILLIASIILGIVFISAGMGKILGQSAFLLNLPSMPAWLRASTENWLPWLELIVGLALVIGVLTRPAALIAIALSAAFMFYNVWMITGGHAYEPCSCFGAFEIVFQGRLSSSVALYVDIGLLALALVVYFLYKGKFFNLKP